MLSTSQLYIVTLTSNNPAYAGPFLIYIGITALVRMLVDEIQLEHEASLDIIYISGAILLLAIANLVIRYNRSRFP